LSRDQIAEEVVSHCIIAKDGEIVAAGLVVRIGETMRIGEFGLEHLEGLGFGVHLFNKSIVVILGSGELAGHRTLLADGGLRSVAGLSTHLLDLLLEMKQLLSCPESEGEARIISTWEH